MGQAVPTIVYDLVNLRSLHAEQMTKTAIITKMVLINSMQAPQNKATGYPAQLLGFPQYLGYTVWVTAGQSSVAKLSVFPQLVSVFYANVNQAAVLYLQGESVRELPECSS